ncbi:MAG: sodium:proton exchanger [Candidatus Komeilibacteria bacterium RIFCSPLOWO2_01_FULL_45_10]|uniref:Sodium:proton exchanger n=1 Tax=Candidatus Komeilibacteria bacterium RIFCSPLOWO2_01_FULL_45_10 TaxID=1798550 RepID=A0A1G2BKX8_9BACT|nr:MAG: sodium:proton exchanger [Candidatus Komeilibacteria bacterium RIFCSPLOWO2_01_FULL_45_10]
MLTYLLLIIGFIILIKGADWLVDGASSLAKKLKISTLGIGLTIVAFGTSMPELFVNLFASFQGNTEIAVGNILGSNIANILLILGISAIIYPLTVTRGTVWKEIPFSLLAALMVGIMANDILIDKSGGNLLTRIDGLVLIGFFIIFFYYIFGIAKDQSPADKENNVKIYKTATSLTMIVGGLICMALGGKWIVDGAVALATILGVSQSLIGLTIVAVGTSLPELATSAMAAIKKNSDIAVGNIVGSNIFNIFWVLGVSALIKPLPFTPASSLDIGMTVFATLLLFVWMFIGKKRVLQSWQGMVFLMVYVAYIIILISKERMF